MAQKFEFETKVVSKGLPGHIATVVPVPKEKKNVSWANQDGVVWIEYNGYDMPIWTFAEYLTLAPIEQEKTMILSDYNENELKQLRDKIDSELADRADKYILLVTDTVVGKGEEFYANKPVIVKTDDNEFIGDFDTVSARKEYMNKHFLSPIYTMYKLSKV